MKFNKPKFWDLKKPNLVALILIPLTLPILLNNLLRKFKKKKNTQIFFRFVLEIFMSVAQGRHP